MKNQSLSEQFTEVIKEWENLRLGKFTASQIHKLYGNGKSKDKLFSDGGITYIYETAGEILTGEKASRFEGNAATEWGQMYEPIAIAKLEETNLWEIEHYGNNNPVFNPFPYAKNYAGGSPDFWVNQSKLIGEIKCPINTSIHLKRLRYKTQQDLLKEEPAIYVQIQFNMLCAESCERGLFVSFDDRVKHESMKLIQLPVEHDFEYQEGIANKLMLAITELHTIVPKELIK